MKLSLNGQSIDLEANDLLSLLEQQGIDHSQRGIAIAVNGDFVPRKLWSGYSLADEDQVEIVTAMQGG